MSEPGELLEYEAAWHLVQETTKRAFGVIFDSVKHVDGAQRWLIAARVANNLFTQFYTTINSTVPTPEVPEQKDSQ